MSTALTTEERSRFDALYRNRGDQIVRLLRRRLDSPEDAQELAQEAFLRVLRYRHCGLESLTYLLIRTALNLAASHRARSSGKWVYVQLESRDLVSEAPSPEDALAQDQRMRLTLCAVEALPTRCREVFLLRLLHGMRQREIAQRCGISTRMVEMHLARAQRLIQERMEAVAGLE